jgi:23S rRNA (pseudouridine1915-N3)-methyltransferase
LITCVWIGKSQNASCSLLIKNYQQQLRAWWPVKLIEIPEIEKMVIKYIQSRSRRSILVSLDVTGEPMESQKFSRWVNQTSDEIYFFGWGSNGPIETAKSYFQKTLSLSKMTFSHELARVLLWEQLYRAGLSLKNHPYVLH